MRIAVIGAGPAGLAAAFDLTRAGRPTVVFESSEQAGGLASGFKEPHWEWSVEKYYHHWFESDAEIIRLAEDLGVKDEIIYPKPVTALYHQGSFYAFDSPIAVLKFPGIPFVDRLRFGLVGAYLRFSRDWRSFEKLTAHDWLLSTMGKRAYEALWEPMLEGKFGQEYYRKVNMAWFWARIHARTQRLGTFEGGFQRFMDLAAKAVQEQGGEVRFSSRVESIEPTPDGRLQITSAGESEIFDRVLSTSSPAIFAKSVPSLPDAYLKPLDNLKSLGAVVLTLAMNQSLGRGIYWYNLPKREGFPFLCLVEHTQFVPPEKFGGDHILYCGDYVPVDHPYFAMNEEEIFQAFLPALKKINPGFDPSVVKKKYLFRAPYAQPVPFVNHSKNLPDVKTPIPGLYWASMSHVYPWDRGTNFAVEMGRNTAKRMLEE